MTARDRVTPLVLTWNEEPNIGRALDSLRWAKRVVVLDSGSTDRTEDIARAFPNVSWHVHPFDGFRLQTLRGVREAATAGEFVLALDADMQVPPTFLDELEENFLTGDFVGGRVGFAYRYGSRSLWGSVYPAQVRLFRPERLRVTQRGHGHKFAVDGPVYRFAARLVHDDRKPFRRWLDTQARYSLDEVRALRRGDPARLRDLLRRGGFMPLLAFASGYLTAGGPLAGRAALRYAYERAVFEALLALRLLRGEEEVR
ncbi:MAG: glycosyltransferase family 2 protein [Planctomycetota bacterium]|nr:MAG: glycosyltransferase family 2 protein [Planctomycetota bacterium]